MERQNRFDKVVCDSYDSIPLSIIMPFFDKSYQRKTYRRLKNKYILRKTVTQNWLAFKTTTKILLIQQQVFKNAIS